MSPEPKHFTIPSSPRWERDISHRLKKDLAILSRQPKPKRPWVWPFRQIPFHILERHFEGRSTPFLPTAVRTARILMQELKRHRRTEV